MRRPRLSMKARTGSGPWPIRAVVAGAGLAVALAGVAPAEAQISSVSARARAMGSNYTALARGFSAVRWNPAGLGQEDTPDFSLAFAPFRATTGVGPIGTAALADWDNRVVPADVRLEWLETITDAGGEHGTAGAEVTAVAFSVGRFGFQYGVVAEAAVHLAPDAAELVLFGNAGLTGEPRPFQFSGSTVQATVTSTVAFSYGQPLPFDLDLWPGEQLALGLTLTRTMGHAVVYGRDVGSRATADPVEIEIEFPIVHPDTSEGYPEFGSGWGLDLGLAWTGGPWSAGLVARNIVHTFEWDVDALVFTPAEATFTIDTATSSFEERPIGEAPDALVEAVEGLTYRPELAAGLAWSDRRVALAADVRHRLGDGMQTAPRSQLGVGAEVRPIPAIPLRVGAAWVTDGYRLTGGLGIETGAINLGASVGLRRSELEDAVAFAFTLSFGSP